MWQWRIPSLFPFVGASGTANQWHKIPTGIDYSYLLMIKMPASVLALRKNPSHNILAHIDIETLKTSINSTCATSGHEDGVDRQAQEYQDGLNGAPGVIGATD
jgi:hypothetical protein